MSIKSRVEALENAKGTDKKIIVIRRFDEPGRKADNRTSEELKAEYPDHRIVILERKDMSKGKKVQLDE